MFENNFKNAFMAYVLYNTEKTEQKNWFCIATILNDIFIS